MDNQSGKTDKYPNIGNKYGKCSEYTLYPLLSVLLLRTVYSIAKVYFDLYFDIRPDYEEI